MRKEVRTAANKPAYAIHVNLESTLETLIYTYKCRDAIHIICQVLEPSFIMDLSFFTVKTPEGIGTIIEVVGLAVSPRKRWAIRRIVHFPAF
jgi:hypothetical protein